MQFDFPSSPSIGQKYPAPPIDGAPLWTWDGEKWSSLSGEIASGALPSNAMPPMDGAAAPGTVAEYARGDHVHPTDTSRAPKNNSNFTGTLTAQNFVVTGSSQLASINATSLTENSGGATFTGVTTSQLTVTGTLSLAGTVQAPAKGHQLGTYSGTAPTGALAQTDANILLYDAGGGNWAGLGTDAAGWFWIRTGLSGNPAAAMFVEKTQTVTFSKSPTAPTPAAADNSTALATTAWVNANAPVGSYLPITGGVVNGNVVVKGDCYAHRANGAAYGLIFLNQAASMYLYSDGVNYHFSSAPVVAGNGRLWGTSDFGFPMGTGRLAYIADYHHTDLSGLAEPYGGGCATAAAPGYVNGGTGEYGPLIRYRAMQVYTTGWYTIGYA